MTTMEVGPIGPQVGPIGPQRRKRAGKLRETVRGAIQGAIHAAFAGWRGGSKALSAATERAPRTTSRYMAGLRSMDAVDFVMALLRCPHFVAAMGERLAHIGENGHLLQNLKARAIGRARKVGGKVASLRLRFRRRSKMEAA